MPIEKMGHFLSSSDDKKNNRELPEEKNFPKQETINDIQIRVNLVRGYYEIYFPQIDLREAENKGICDQVISIGEEAEDAEKIFALACKLAEQKLDVYEIYLKISEAVEDLEDNED